jgi:NIPSNAP
MHDRPELDSALIRDERGTSMKLNFWKSKGSKSESSESKGSKTKGWTVCAVALVSFAAGSLTTARWMHVTRVRADGDHVFELRLYHALPAKMPALESRFRDTTSKLLAKHDLKAVGYWETEGDAPAWENTFIFIVDHPSREDAKKHWQAFVTDPEFQNELKSEQASKLVDKVDSTYMRAEDFSPMK